MRSDVKRGLLAGIIAGIIFGILLQAFHARTPAGNRVTMMELIAEMTGTRRLIWGWLYHLFDSAVIGAIFGGIMGSKTKTYKDALKHGSLFGLAWWFLGGLILGPFFLGMSLFAPQTLGPFPPLAVPSLLGQVLFGCLLGEFYVALRGKAEKAEIRKIRTTDEEAGPLRRAQ